MIRESGVWMPHTNFTISPVGPCIYLRPERIYLADLAEVRHGMNVKRPKSFGISSGCCKVCPGGPAVRETS